jgi:hypothetical protein
MAGHLATHERTIHKPVDIDFDVVRCERSRQERIRHVALRAKREGSPVFRRRRSAEDATLTDIYMILRDLRAEMQTQRAVVVPAMESMASAFALMVQRLEDEREERRALVEALHALTRSMQSREGPRDSPRPHVIGGSVFAVPANGDDNAVVVLDEPNDAQVRFTPGDDVRCRFGDSWIEGLEVCEVVSGNGHVRYRLQRTVDHYVLPATFPADDVAPGEISPEADTARKGGWSRT